MKKVKIIFNIIIIYFLFIHEFNPYGYIGIPYIIPHFMAFAVEPSVTIDSTDKAWLDSIYYLPRSVEVINNKSHIDDFVDYKSGENGILPYPKSKNTAAEIRVVGADFYTGMVAKMEIKGLVNERLVMYVKPGKNGEPKYEKDMTLSTFWGHQLIEYSNNGNKTVDVYVDVYGIVGYAVSSFLGSMF